MKRPLSPPFYDPSESSNSSEESSNDDDIDKLYSLLIVLAARHYDITAPQINSDHQRENLPGLINWYIRSVEKEREESLLKWQIGLKPKNRRTSKKAQAQDNIKNRFKQYRATCYEVFQCSPDFQAYEEEIARRVCHLMSEYEWAQEIYAKVELICRLCHFKKGKAYKEEVIVK